MGRRDLGKILLGAGALLIVVGLVGSLVGRTAVPAEAAGELPQVIETTTTSGIPTTTATTTTATTLPPPTTTLSPPPPTSQATTSTTRSSTTTTTTTLAPGQVIADFITAFGAAIAAEDVDWLFARLHPAMILGYGEDVCRGFIEDEILQLKEYTLRGAVTGPVAKTLETNVGSVTVEGIYEAEITFVFQGQSFDADADFVLNGETTWLATCR